MKERPFGGIEKFRFFFDFTRKKRKMRNFNSLIVTKNVKWGPLVFFNIHSGAKHQKRGPFEDFKNFKKSLTKPKKGRGKSHSAENLEGVFLGFAFQGRDHWRRS